MITLRIIFIALLNFLPGEVQDFLKSKGVKVKVETIDISGPHTLGTQVDYFYRLRAAFLGKVKNEIVVSDAFESGGNVYTFGNTQGTFSHVACTEYNTKGEARKLHCLVAISHEYGHQRGLKDETPGSCKTIMDGDALKCSNLLEIGFSKEQLRVINK